MQIKNNFITGTIHNTLKNQKNIRMSELDRNLISGIIPEEVFRILSLELLNLFEN